MSIAPALPPTGYSLNRLAVLSGWAEPSLRRLVASDASELMDMHDLNRAVIAAKALKHGHSPACIRAINATIGGHA